MFKLIFTNKRIVSETVTVKYKSGTCDCDVLCRMANVKITLSLLYMACTIKSKNTLLMSDRDMNDTFEKRGQALSAQSDPMWFAMAHGCFVCLNLRCTVRGKSVVS